MKGSTNHSNHISHNDINTMYRFNNIDTNKSLQKEKTESSLTSAHQTSTTQQKLGSSLTTSSPITTNKNITNNHKVETKLDTKQEKNLIKTGSNLTTKSTLVENNKRTTNENKISTELPTAKDLGIKENNPNHNNNKLSIETSSSNKENLIKNNKSDRIVYSPSNFANAAGTGIHIPSTIVKKSQDLNQNNHSILDRKNTVKAEAGKTKYKGFFDDTSKENDNMAKKALGMFVSGIIAFFCSIHLTCWNERRAVKEAEFTDFISKEKYCTAIENGAPIKKEEYKSNHVYLISGNLDFEKAAEIPDLNLEYNTGGRHIIILTEVEKYEEWTEQHQQQQQEGGGYGAGAGSNGTVTKTKHWWVKTTEGDQQYRSNTYYGSANIKNYKVRLENLVSQVHLGQTSSIADNKCIHKFKDEEENILTEYFKKTGNSDIKVIVKNQYCYIIRENASGVSKDSFNPETYHFSKDDRRLCIKYVSIITNLKNVF